MEISFDDRVCMQPEGGGQELHSRNQRPLVDGYSPYSQVVGLHFIFYTPDMPQVWNLDLIIKLLL